MSKPKNMTPEQEAAWRERERLRRATPEWKAAAAARGRRWYEKGNNRERVIAANRAKRATAEGRADRNAKERAALATRDHLKEKARARLRAWASTEEGKQKNRAKAARHYRLKREYEHFMAALEAEARGEA